MVGLKWDSNDHEMSSFTKEFLVSFCVHCLRERQVWIWLLATTTQVCIDDSFLRLPVESVLPPTTRSNLVATFPSTV